MLVPYIFRVISSLLVFSHGLQAGGVCSWSEMTACATRGWQPVIMWIKGFLRSEGFPWCPWFPPPMVMAWKRGWTNGSQAVSSPWDVWVWLHVLVLEQRHWYQSIFHPLRDILCAGKMRLHHLPTVMLTLWWPGQGRMFVGRDPGSGGKE